MVPSATTGSLSLEPENSTGIGLANLNSRYKILMHREIEIMWTMNDCFTVNLPFKK